MLFNKNTYRKTNDKKLLHKIGKRWVTVSIAMLALLGGSFAMKSVTTHASVVPNSQQQTVAVKTNINNSLQKSQSNNTDQNQNVKASGNNTNTIQSSATNLHNKLVANNIGKTNSATSGLSASSASGESASSSASKPKGLMLDAPSKPESTNSSVVNSGSSKVSQPSSVSASSSSASGKGMNTLDLGNSSQQARGWNFVQHGIRNNDYASVNNSESLSVNNSASGNQTASMSSSSAKSNVASAPINQKNQSSLNSLNAKLKAMGLPTNASSNASVANANTVNADSNSNNNEKNKVLLKDNAQPDYFSGGVTKTGNDAGLNYKVYANGGVEFTGGTANTHLDMLNFNDDTQVAKAIKFDNNIDTSKVSDMSDMFMNDKALQSLTLPSSFNTSNVTNMRSMFEGDESLQSLILPSSFNTSKVTDMDDMFQSDKALQSLTLPSSFDTSKVTSMMGMFNSDKALQSLTLPSSFNTHKASDMKGMFMNDKALQSLTLPSSFNTSNVSDMSYMFNGDESLQSLILPSSFNTSKVTNMSDMFQSDKALQSLTLPSSFNTSKITNMSDMFQSDNLLNTITLESPNNFAGLASQKKTNNVRPNVDYPTWLDKAYRKDANGDYTSATSVDLLDGQPHTGTFVATPNPHLVTDNIIFYTNRSGKNVRVGSDEVRDTIGTSYNVQQAFSDAQSDYSDLSGYTLDSNAPQTITLTNGAMHKIQIDSNQQANNSDDVPVAGNIVTFKGNIILNFPENDHNHQIKVPYSINTQVDSRLKDILDDGIENGNPSVTVPNDYVNKTIQQFNTQNFTYTNAKSSQSDTYDNVYIQPTDGTSDAPNVSDNGNGTYTYNNPDITFNFTANTVPETIHYQYNGKDISNNPKDANGNQETNDPSTTTISGANDTQGSLASNNVPDGWHIATGSNGEPNGNNSWTYGNEDKDNPQGSHNVNIMPNSAKATIQYRVSDKNSNSTNNSDSLNTVTKTGNDYRATDAGNNTFNANTSSDIPTGYHIISNQNNNIPYDNNANGSHTIRIIGNEHNQEKHDTDPSNASNTNPSTLPKTDPNYVPASDVVTIKSVEYVAGNNTPVGTITQYMAVSGKTGEKNSFNPNDYQPDGYSTVPNEPSQSVTIKPNGVNPNIVTFSYDAQTEDNITAVIQYKDNTGTEHTLARHDITGPTSSKGNIYTYKDSKNDDKQDLAIPQGYHFINAFGGANGKTPEPSSVNGIDFPYTIEPNGQNIIINVAGNTVTPKKSVTPNQPTVPSDNPVNPINPSDVPSRKPSTPTNLSDASDTFYVTIKDWDGKRLVRTYQKRMTKSGNIGDQFSINPNTYITNGYSKTNSDNIYNGYIGANQKGKVILLSSDDKTPNNNVTWNYMANPQSATITYKDQAGNTTKTAKINGHTDSDIDVTKPSDGGSVLPSGYHTNPNTNYNYQFNSPTNDPNNNSNATYSIKGNSISGTATINTSYDEESDNQVTNVDSTGKFTINLNGHHVGDKIVVDPTDYEKDNYDDSNKYWTIPMDWDTVSHNSSVDNNGDVTNYNPTHSFTYYGPAAEADITYVDASHALTQSDESNPNYTSNGTRTYKGKTYPVVGHQVLHHLGTLGSVVNLTAKGSTTGTKDMIAPNGYHFVNNNSNNRVLVPNVQVLGGMMKFTLFLGANRVMPKPNRPTNKPSSASVKPSSASVAPSSKASSATSSSVVPSNVSPDIVIPSSTNSVSSASTSTVPTSVATPSVSSASQSSSKAPVESSAVTNHKSNKAKSASSAKPVVHKINRKPESATPKAHVNKINTRSVSKASSTPTKAVQANSTNSVESGHQVATFEVHKANNNVPYVVAPESEPTNAESTPVAHASNNSAVAKDTATRHNATNTKTNNTHKLPQTNEASSNTLVASIIMLLASAVLAGVSLERKHTED